MSNGYEVIVLTPARELIEDMPLGERADAMASIGSLKDGDFKSVYVKKLRGSIGELIVQRYRIIFFIKNSRIWIVDAFIKKSKKTPVRVIEKAEKIYSITP